MREAAFDGAKPLDLDKIERFSGTHTFLTEEGPIVIEVAGDTVLVTESLDPQVTDRLEATVFGAAGKP